MQESLYVWYGFRRLGGVVKTPSVCVIFENCDTANNEQKVKRWIDIVYRRLQTKIESSVASQCNRLFSLYEQPLVKGKKLLPIEETISKFIDHDAAHLSPEKLEKIKKLLIEEYYTYTELISQSCK